MSTFTLSKTWQVLGPFPIGTREQDFGADPLENYGGFQKLRYSTGAKYPSELVEGGFVGWTMINSNDHTLGPIDFKNARWSENGKPFGWSIEQYQAWARGILITHEPVQLFVQISGVSEFYIHGTRYHGDCYGYNTTTHLIQFDKGTHAIDVRMVHDVRMFGGGKAPPQCQCHVRIEPKDEASMYPEDCAIITPCNSTASTTNQQGASCELLMPDYLNDIGFAGSYGSVSIQNAGEDPIIVKSVTLCIVDDHSLESRNKNGLFMEYKTELIVDHGPLCISPGQIRPVGFSFQKEWGSLPATTKILRFWVRIGLAVKDSNNVIVATSTVVEDNDMEEGGDEFAIRATGSVQCVDWLTAAFKYTFLDYDNTVQYAMAKRPHVLNSDASKPILVALHGAGVETDSSFWINSIPTQKHCWIVFPTGRTPWGYDWHGPSTRNVFKSLEGLAEIQELLPPHFECMDFATTGGDWVTVSAPQETTRTLKPHDDRDWNIGSLDTLIVMGHSNGGQGVWHLAVHFPDKIIAVVPAAGYLKIQDYVSFANWVGNSYSDPWLRGILESSIAEYNNDLHLSNMVNIAVLPRVGTQDDNVPPLHTRKYVRILNSHLQQPTAIKTSEVLGQGHWWDTVFDDKTVQRFLDQYSSPQQKKRELNEFCITLMNPAGNGSVYGIHVEQMMIPYRLGKIKGAFTTTDNKTLLTLKTTNIASFRFTKHFKGCNKLIVDGDKFSHLEKYHTLQGGVTLSFDGKKSKRWKLEGIKSNERSAANYGPIHRMYESTKPLVVIIPSCTSHYKHIALQIAHDWYLYGRGDSMILCDTQAIASAILDYPYHIYLGLVNENKRIESILADKPTAHIDFEKTATMITGIKVGDKVYRDPGTGILFMRPINKHTTAIVVSGMDHDGFESAWHLLPRRTGMMIPEWIVTSKDMKSSGIGGVLGAGYFDNEWKPFGYM
ncbi:unnamed protein product [Mucor circinelloides]